MRRAFTLIELLVVLAIVSVLIGILLPALSKARLASQAVKSQANLRTLSQLHMFYASDHNDRFYARWQAFPDFGRSAWQTEMYAFHWYAQFSRDWVHDRGYGMSEEQFSPADKSCLARQQDWRERYSDFGVTYDCSYVYSPTLWFPAARYTERGRLTPRLDTSDPRRSPAQLRLSDVRHPAYKAMLWERFDWTKSRRTSAQWNGSGLAGTGREHGFPTWNNPDATPSVASVDGSILRINIRMIYENADGIISPDLWNPTQDLLEAYKMGEDGLENGSDLARGLYPALFWATRDGVHGRDWTQ